MSVAGPAATTFIAAMLRLGIDVEHTPGPVGAASSRKLLRSVVFKGIAAAVLEAISGAEAVGCVDWFRAHITTEFAKLDSAAIDRLVTGSRRHASRRAAEMDAAASQLTGLGVTPHIANATRDSLSALASSTRENPPAGPLDLASSFPASADAARSPAPAWTSPPRLGAPPQQGEA
jgi:3-hydroxyisobutyrate dehydrogenase-like beta-hydroxyacid dehydrogenase